METPESTPHEETHPHAEDSVISNETEAQETIPFSSSKAEEKVNKSSSNDSEDADEKEAEEKARVADLIKKPSQKI